MKKTVLMTALAALVLSSCVKEKLEEPVSLRYALDDGTGITNAFIRVEDGYVRHYTTDAIFVLGGKKIWRCAGNEFSEQSHSQYSLYGEKMEFRQQSNLGSGGRLKNGVLTVLGRRWTAIDGFSPDYYSSIVFPSF